MVKLVMVLAIIMVLLPGCEREDECRYEQFSPVTAISGPVSGSVNTDIPIEVSFIVYNGCGGLGEFQTSTTGNSRTIEVIGEYVGCICTQDIPTRQANYIFRASQPGTYELKFVRGPNDFIVHTIVVS